MDPKRNKINTQTHLVCSRDDKAVGIELSIINEKNKTATEPGPVRREPSI